MAVSDLEREIERAAELVTGSQYPVALVGAGMSVESGIPPFRGPGGLWTKYGEPPMDGYRRFLEDKYTGDESCLLRHAERRPAAP